MDACITSFFEVKDLLRSLFSQEGASIWISNTKNITPEDCGQGIYFFQGSQYILIFMISGFFMGRYEHSAAVFRKV
jgi:hypothetical protein